MRTLSCLVLFILSACGTPSGGDTVTTVSVNQEQNQGASGSSSSASTTVDAVCEMCLAEVEAAEQEKCLAGFNVDITLCP